MLAALEEANRVIIERDEANRMGTTVTGLVGLETAGADHLMVFNVGDSRVYRLAADGIEQLTVDHSEVQELLLDGRDHPGAGTDPPAQEHRHPRPGHRPRACSPTTGCCPPSAATGSCSARTACSASCQMRRSCRCSPSGTPQQAAEALVMAANDVGGRDNMTAVIVDIESDDDGADETTMPREALRRPGPWWCS